jgi:hypothetical protein
MPKMSEVTTTLAPTAMGETSRATMSTVMDEKLAVTAEWVRRMALGRSALGRVSGEGVAATSRHARVG